MPDEHAAITRDEVAHLARLSRLALREDELGPLVTQLDDIISAVARVQEVTAEDIPPTSHALPLTNVFRADEVLTNVFRADEVRPGLTPEQALSGAPATEQQRFKVPRILDEEA